MPVFVIAISALLALATITVALLLLVGLETAFVAVAVSVSVMLVPEGVPKFTCSTSVKFAVCVTPTAKLPLSVHVIVPVPPTGGTVPHVQPAGGVMDWKVVLGGVVCVKVAPVAAAGPSLVTLWVYVTLLPAETEVGAAEFVTMRSACVAVATTSAAVALLLAKFGSDIEELTLAVSLIAVPAAVPAFTCTMYVKFAGALAARDGSVQVSVARVHVHPAGPVNDTAVVFAGRVSVNVTVLLAVLGPALFTVWL